MSKNNRANRDRKKRAQKSKPRGGVIPPMPPEFADPAVRRRFAIMIPFLYLAKRNPYTPGMSLPDGSLIIGRGTSTQGYIPGDQVPQLIAETQRELDVSFDEVISMLGGATANGLVEITGDAPPQQGDESAPALSK